VRASRWQWAAWVAWAFAALCCGHVGVVTPVAWAAAAQEHKEAGEDSELARLPFGKWGGEVLAQIEKDLSVSGSDLYAEWATIEGQRGSDYGRFSFVWPAAYQLLALTAAAKADPQRYRARLVRFADALEQYWKVKEGMGGYAVLPGGSERYYDDNAWVVLGLLEAYQLTGQSKCLAQAVKTLTFIAGGEKKTKGGGIRQHEDKPGGAAICTTAPATVGALRLYEITKNPKFLQAAERWYAWMTSKEVGVQDPSDGLYHQGAELADGTWKVNLGKRAYQSALPLRAALLLHQIKKDDSYLAEAQRIAASAVAHWVQPSGALKETGQWGGSDLCDALLDLCAVDGNPERLATVRRVLRFLHENGRDRNGCYGEYWHEDRRAEPLKKWLLLHMAPVARAYWRAAAYEPSKRE